jgi:predicted nucleic acid-binding protein
VLKIYLDNCCYNRPFDDLSIERNRLEAEAVNQIIQRKGSKFELVTGFAVLFEIGNIKNDDKRQKAMRLYSMCNEYYKSAVGIEKLAKQSRKYGLRELDSLHFATAEYHKVDFLLTTDDDFVNTVKRFKHDIKVYNPLDFVKEIKGYDIEY